MRILGLDIGSVRIGVAISDPTGFMANPLEIVERGPNDIERIKELVEEYQVEEIVAGLPLTMRGERGAQALLVEEYVERLAGSVDVPMKLWDERLTSVAAERAMAELEVKKGKKKKLVDKVAAAIILQAYLDSRRGAGEGHAG